MKQNERLLKTVVDRLAKARIKSPTVTRLCWPVVPMLVVAGVLSVIALVALDMPNETTFLAAGMYLGAALSAFGIARKTIRLWPIHRELYDWHKIETLAENDQQRHVL
jgi:hypothetical protein